MTLAEKKNRLREYRLLKHEISALELELSSIDDMFAVLDEFELNPSDDIASKANQRKKELKARIAEVESKRASISKAIDSLDDVFEKRIIKMRYIQNKSWSKIAEALKLSEKTCRKYANDGIEKLIL